MLISLSIGRINVKDYDVIISGRRTLEEIITVMDVDNADTAIQKAEILLAKKLGCEVSELTDIEVERCVYVDPGEDADYRNMGEQKTLRNIQGT